MDQNSINFLRDSLLHNRDIRNGLDQKASIILGLSGVIFTLSIGSLEKLQFLVLAITSFFAALLSIFAIFLPFRRQTKNRFSLICWLGFLFKNFDDYKREVYSAFESEEKTSQEYMKEIWSLANYSLKPKTKLLKWASSILTLGLLMAFVLFFV